MVRNNFNSTLIAICHCFYRFVQPPQSNHSFRDIRTAHIFSVAQNILCKCDQFVEIVLISKLRNLCGISLIGKHSL